ncbi:unnamed protein product [Trichobilharzia regenti]|nr:unnamed protein product [Trichobilharzia regenti]
MDLVKAEIARQREKLASSGLVGNNKFFKRSLLKQKEEEEYLSKSKRNKEQANNYEDYDYKTKIDDAEDEEFYKSGRKRQDSESQSTESSSVSSTLDVETKKNTLTEEQLEKMKVDLARYVTLKEGTATDDATTAVVAISKLSPNNVCTNDFDEAFHEQVIDHVLRYLKFLLSKWGHALNTRTKEEKLSYSGKMASATYTQTVEYIKPLLRALQNNRCKGDILNSLVKIMVLMMDRNYLKVSFTANVFFCNISVALTS